MARPQGWEAIRAEVLARIHARLWQPGDTIPTEQILAQEFGCARATVNRALRDLAAAGVLERRRKAGTRVALTPVRIASFRIPITRLEVEGRGQTYGFVLLEQTEAAPPASLADRLGPAAPARMWHLRSLHLADGSPFLYEDRWLNPAALTGAPLPDFRTISVNEWLVRNLSYTAGDIAFSAANASAAEAEALQVLPGTALLITERATRAGALPITAVRLAHAPGHRVKTVL